MQKAGGHQTIVLFVHFHAIDRKQIALKEAHLCESLIGKNDVDEDKNEGNSPDSRIHVINIS